MTVRQDQQSRIVGQQRAASPALLKVPANELVSILDVEGRSAPGRHPEPLALVSDRVTQLLADQGGIVQIVMLNNQVITARQVLGRGQQPDLCMFQNVLFVGGEPPSFRFCHPRE